MRRSKFRRPCKVLIFNGARVLMAIVRSLLFGIFLGLFPLLIYSYGRITLFEKHRKGFDYTFVPKIKI